MYLNNVDSHLFTGTGCSAVKGAVEIYSLYYAPHLSEGVAALDFQPLISIRLTVGEDIGNSTSLTAESHSGSIPVQEGSSSMESG